MSVAGLRMSSKVVLMKVSSHIILRRLRPVESYSLNSLGAFKSLLLPPLYLAISFWISMLTNLKSRIYCCK